MFFQRIFILDAHNSHVAFFYLILEQLQIVKRILVVRFLLFLFLMDIFFLFLMDILFLFLFDHFFYGLWHFFLSLGLISLLDL
jgi:hypothetical protein